jgi:hypothetical protein
VVTHHALDVAGLREQRTRRRTALLVVDLPADDLAAVQVDDQVEVEEQPAHQGRQVGDVPDPHPVRAAAFLQAGELGNPSAHEGLAAREPHSVDAKCGERAHDTLDLVEG